MSWEQKVRQVTPYIPGEQPNKENMIKLNANECPYPPAPGVQRISEQFRTGDLRLYPDPSAGALTKCLAEYYGVEPEQVFVGVGSDDVLAMAFLTFFNSDKPILFPDVTYSFYDVWAELYRIPYKTCALDDNFRIVAEDYRQENGGIIFPNPNAPTGVMESVEVIEEIVRANSDSVVIIDEAYIDFGGISCLPLLEKYDNLLVVQTFSKSRAMAGMRIGFAIGNKKMIQYLQDAKYSFNSYTLNRSALEMGVEAVRDDVYFKEITGQIVKTREWVKRELTGLGFSYPEPWGNFIFATHQEAAAGELFAALKQQDIYVRYWNKPRIGNYLRITIGTMQEMETLIQFLRDYLK